MKKLIMALHLLLTNKKEYEYAIMAYNRNIIYPEYRLAIEIIRYFKLK